MPVPRRSLRSCACRARRVAARPLVCAEELVLLLKPGRRVATEKGVGVPVPSLPGGGVLQCRAHPGGEFSAVADQETDKFGVGLGEAAPNVPDLGQRRARVVLHAGQQELAEAGHDAGRDGHRLDLNIRVLIGVLCLPYTTRTGTTPSTQNHSCAEDTWRCPGEEPQGGEKDLADSPENSRVT